MFLFWAVVWLAWSFVVLLAYPDHDLEWGVALICSTVWIVGHEIAQVIRRAS